MYPKRLVFCGGGTRCLVFIQTLVELEHRNMLTNVREYWGTSAGALLASLYALSKSAKPLKELMFSANYMKFRDIDVTNILTINSSWGLDDGKSLVSEIERMFESMEVGSKTKRMGDVPGLNIIVSDLNIHTTIVCNKETFPNLRVVDAIRASMSLPIYFRPFVNPENGHYWIDGAVRANFPWDLLPDDAARSEALGFNFEKSLVGGPKKLSEYIFSMIHFDEPKKIIELRKNWGNNIIWYPSPPYPAWFVCLKKEDYALIESLGRSAFEIWNASKREAETSPFLKTTEIPTASSAHHTVLPSSPMHHISETSDIPKSPCLLLQQHPSSPQTQNISLASRRWSV